MQRINSTIVRSAPRAFPSARLTVPISSRALQPSLRPYGTTSSPPQAEDASAQSGGSRSKEAAETGSSPTGGTIKEGGPPQTGSKSKSNSDSPTEGVVPDELADGDVRGRTGGGEPLEASQGAPKPPLVDSHSLPGGKPKLTKEQQAEVDEHNRDFEAKHGRAEPAQEDKVDPKFWSNKGKETGAM